MSLAVLAVVLVMGVLLRPGAPPTPEARTPERNAARTPPATVPQGTTSDDPALLSPEGAPFEALAVRSELIVSGAVVDLGPASEPGWAVLTLAVEEVWRGDFALGVPLRALVPVALTSIPALHGLLPDPGAWAGDLSGLEHQQVVVFASSGPTDSGRLQVRLEGEERVYVRVGEELLRASCFVAGEMDPAPESLTSLRAAIEKAGPAD